MEKMFGSPFAQDISEQGISDPFRLDKCWLPMDKNLRDTFMAGRWTLAPFGEDSYCVEVIDDGILGELVDERELLSYEDIDGRKLVRVP
jgi:hypothetical protein